jgi:hypothetical protein
MLKTNENDVAEKGAGSLRPSRQFKSNDQTIEAKISRMVVAPLPVVALLILVQRFEVAIVFVAAVPVGVVDNDFMIVPTMVVVVIFVIVTDRSRAADARRGRQSNGRECQQRGTALQSSHTVNLLILFPENDFSYGDLVRTENGHNV